MYLSEMHSASLKFDTKCVEDSCDPVQESQIGKGEGLSQTEFIDRSRQFS